MPQVHYFGQEGLHNVLVIDLLGPNLEDLFDMCGRKFTIKTVCMAAKQMVCVLDPSFQPYFDTWENIAEVSCLSGVVSAEAHSPPTMVPSRLNHPAQIIPSSCGH